MIHQAIYNTHPNVRAIRDNEDGTVVCLDQDENVVTLDGSEVEESTRLQSIYDSNQYQRDRQYPAIADQLDMLWHSIDAGEFGDTAKQSEFYTANKAVKDANPKG